MAGDHRQAEPAAWRLAHPEPTLAPEIGTHRLLGYTPREGQEVVLFYTDSSWSATTPIEFLPVADGNVAFGLYDAAVRQTLSVAELRRIVAEHTTRPARTSGA